MNLATRRERGYLKHELIGKLAALVPPSRKNRVRYHGVLAPDAADRNCIVPGRNVEPTASCLHVEQPVAPQPLCRFSWALLLARVFRVDVTECPRLWWQDEDHCFTG
jgi:hypothetical protein